MDFTATWGATEEHLGVRSAGTKRELSLAQATVTPPLAEMPAEAKAILDSARALAAEMVERLDQGHGRGYTVTVQGHVHGEAAMHEFVSGAGTGCDECGLGVGNAIHSTDTPSVPTSEQDRFELRIYSN